MKIVRILVPVDFSKGSELAFEWAMLLASKSRGATIYLLHIIPSKTEQAAQGFAGVGYLMEEEDAKREMTKWLKNLPGGVVGFSLFAKGRIPEIIENLCHEKSVDLVIMTTRGRRGMEPLLPNSTTEETIRGAPCPVLVLHQNSKTPVDGPKASGARKKG